LVSKNWCKKYPLIILGSSSGATTKKWLSIEITITIKIHAINVIFSNNGLLDLKDLDSPQEEQPNPFYQGADFRSRDSFETLDDSSDGEEQPVLSKFNTIERNKKQNLQTDQLTTFDYSTLPPPPR